MNLATLPIVNEKARLKRQLGIVDSGQDGPTVIFICGMHGNEPSGITAYQRVMYKLKKSNTLLSGKLIGFVGNIGACEVKKRYLHKDLNRLWTIDNMTRIEKNTDSRNFEEAEEQRQLYQALAPYLKQTDEEYPLIFVDLHTTSSESNPYLLINDTLKNRALAQNLPLPIVLGMEEHLKGTLLNYINDLGHISIGFEAGQHDAVSSINNHEALIWQILYHAGSLSASLVPDTSKYHNILAKYQHHEVFEVRYRHDVSDSEFFEMKPGYINFQDIKKGETVAADKLMPVEVKENGKIFMPLYQQQGDDGFFIIRRVRWFWLKLSSLFRKIHLHKLISILPGIHKYKKRSDILIVNNTIAKYYLIEFFHLMGFRRKRKIGHYVVFSRREIS